MTFIISQNEDYIKIIIATNKMGLYPHIAYPEKAACLSTIEVFCLWTSIQIPYKTNLLPFLYKNVGGWLTVKN